VYLPYFADPSAAVRASAVSAFKGHEDAVLQNADAILRMMSVAVQSVQYAAYNALGSGGEAILPFVRRARRTAPTKVRPELREMLLEMVGYQDMDARDQVAIRRFLEVRALGAEPAPMHLCGSWLAFPTADQRAVLDALDLSDPMTVPMTFGADAWNRDQHEWTSHNACRRMYVTPALDGWTLAFGQMPEAAHVKGGGEAMVPVILDRCRRLSAVLGEAHWYGESCGDSWTSWCIARDGEIVRFYDAFDTAPEIGDPLPEEGSHATTVADMISVNPEELGPDTDVRGNGVLALTSCGRERGMPRGALHL
jgi:hypothetical protein